MHVFRRIVLPVSYLVVLLIIAIALAWLAFRPQASTTVDGEPTGEVLAEETVVARGDVSNVLSFDGKIEVEPAKDAKASETGTLVHVFEQSGRKVKKGAQLYQIKVEGEAEAPAPAAEPGSDGDAAEPAPAPAPRPRYVNVVAPADGVVGDYAAEKGDDVAKGQAVTSIEQDSFRAVASIEPAQLYRIPKMPDTGTVTITDGPQPFECTSLRLNQVSGSRSAGDSAGDSDGEDAGAEPAPDDSEAPAPEAGASGPSISCEVPDEVTVYNGLNMKLELDAGSATDVLIVPTTAVRGTIGDGSVWVIDDSGEPVETPVKLGINDGENVEITEGLEEGQSIAAYVPGAEPESPEDFDEGGMVDEGEM